MGDGRQKTLNWMAGGVPWIRSHWFSADWQQHRIRFHLVVR